MSCTISFPALAGVDGSARFTWSAHSACTALASVSGPIALPPSLQSSSSTNTHAHVDLHLRPAHAVGGPSARAAGAVLRALVERMCLLRMHPRTGVVVVVQDLGAGKANHAQTAARINACSLALLNAGSVPMRGVVCAVAVQRSGHRLVLCPDESIDANGDADGGGGCFAFLFGAGRGDTDDGSNAGGEEVEEGGVPPSDVVWTNYAVPAHSPHVLDAAELTRARALARRGAQDVWRAMKASVGRGGLPVGKDEAVDMDTGMAEREEDAQVEI